MRRLVLKELLLLSKKEKKAKKITFSSETTVIIGDNGTGKSSLIKSIYHTLGADVQFDSKWKSANVSSLISFLYGDKNYSLLRNNDRFSLFDSNFNLVKSVLGITTGISPILASLFDFNLKLKNHKNGYLLATPAFQYLPYYVDQDKGWLNPWCSFEGLGQFIKSDKDILEYHVGIKPKEYYDANEKIDGIKTESNRLKSELDGLIYARDKLEAENKGIEFNIDIESYKAEIDLLLLESRKLNKIQNQFKARLIKLNNEKISIEQQITALELSLKELDADYNYATNKILDDHIECPTCGTDFENSFIHRFSIAEDVSICQDMLIALKEQLVSVNGEILKAENDFLQNKSHTDKIEKFLNEKKGVVQFKDIIKSESQKEIKQVFKNGINSYNEKIDKLCIEEERFKDERKKYTDKLRSKRIKEYYNTMIESSLFKLNLYNKTLEDYKDLPTKIKDSSGSDKPRALMAYYYSVLKTIHEFSTSAFFPIVIDSPNQQDQDDANKVGIIKFALNEKPVDFQLILGSVELYGVPYNGCFINLGNDNRYSLLSEDEFNEVDSIISPLLEQAYSNEDL